MTELGLGLGLGLGFRVRVRVRAIESDPFLTLFAPKRPKNLVQGSLLSGRVTLYLAGARPSGVTFWP